MNAVPDARLVTSALDGDEAAFAALVERHRGRARAAAHRLLGDWTEAEDVAQEALLEAHRTLERLRDPERFGGWVSAIAANLAKMRLRSRRSGWTSLEELEGGRRFAATGIDLDDDRRLLHEALSELPDAQRETLILHYVNGYSTGEIAALRGDSPGAVRVRLHRARSRLRRRLALQLKEVTPMIEVELAGIVVRVATEPPEAEPPELLSPLRMVLLREKGGTRQLSIWIGAFEGDALALQRAGEQTPRPMTHDLMARMLDAVEARVERVAITELRENTFYALVTVVVDGRREELDARPSDAINLAVRLDAPIFVADEVMAESGSPERIEDEWERFCPPEELERPGGLRSLTPELVKALWPKPPEPKEP